MTRAGRLESIALATLFVGVAVQAVVPSAASAQAAGERSPVSAASQATTASPNLDRWLNTLDDRLSAISAMADAGQLDRSRQAALRLYLDNFEPIESYYGPGGAHAREPLAPLVASIEPRFHELMRAESAVRARALADALRGDMQRIRLAAKEADVPFQPGDPQIDDIVGGAEGAVTQRQGTAAGSSATTSEIRQIIEELDRAAEAYRTGEHDVALENVEHAYLEGFEPLESVLPSAGVNRVETLIHLRLRPQIARGAPVAAVDSTFAALRGELLSLDTALAGGTGFWFGAGNAFIIILREGLEAVLLVAAMLAYLSKAGAGQRERNQVYSGVGLGIVASFATWALARTFIPISGGNRELIEGITALVAVAVLLYVSHWLFHKTYVHDWKAYLEKHVGKAVSTGSALAMAGLAFAAVYREGFETVLFYQALLFDTGGLAVLTGFLPGVVLIAAVGFGVIRLGLRLPMKTTFGVTNAILLYLAFVFIGKGIYNLQEAGLFAPHPVAALPDHPALRQIFGFYPLLETLAVQAIFLVGLALSYAYYKWRSRRPARSEQVSDSATEPAAAG